MYSHIDLFFKLISVLLHDIFLHVFVLAITYLINNKHAADIVIGDTTSASGAGTNLKVGGASIRGKAPEKKFGRAPPLFLALKVQLVVLVSAFVMVSTVWSDSCLLFFYSRCLPYPAICKSEGARATRAPWSRRHCHQPQYLSCLGIGLTLPATGGTYTLCCDFIFIHPEIDITARWRCANLSPTFKRHPKTHLFKH